MSRWIYIPHFGLADLRRNTAEELRQFLARQAGESAETCTARRAIENEIARRRGTR